MSRIPPIRPETSRMLLKTGSYYVLHIMVAATVAYAVTGNLLASLTLSLLEPTVQAFAYFFHEKAWDRFGRRKPAPVPAGDARQCPAGLAACPHVPQQAG
ncbi:DUF2061 domain-containing protein [Bordetella sp. 2513F-2]